jgi:lipid-A-disaccharide synthase
LWFADEFVRRLLLFSNVPDNRMNSQKRILIVAGEASADRYGAKLIEHLRRLHEPEALSFYGTGGDEMRNAGVQLLSHIRELAHIGVREALSGLRAYCKTYRSLIAESQRQRPDVAILLDFPEFNLRLAKRMKRLGVKVIYYIGPQIWAWRSGRIRKIRDCVDKMLVILPFEEEYYRSRGVEVEFVGHPLLEDFAPNFDRNSYLSSRNLDPGRKTIAILPGSRRKEIDYILPVMMKAAKCVLMSAPAQFLISVAPTVDPEHVNHLVAGELRGDPNRGCFRTLTSDSRDILANSDFAFVKSGTSSLEAALVGTPFLITYKISSLSWMIGELLIRTSMKGLVNLIAGEEIVPELFQDEAQPEKLARLALEYMEKPEKSAAMRSKLAGVRERLGVRCASAAAAANVSSYLQSKNMKRAAVAADL